MRVLYATDGSKASRAAGSLITSLSTPSMVEVSVLSVADGEMMFPEVAFLVPNLSEEVNAHAQTEVDRAVAELGRHGFSARGEVVAGLPGRTIVQKAEDGLCDLVVIGAGSRSWLGHLLLGSVSSCVLHNSPVSVLVVHEAPRVEDKLRVMVATDGSASVGAAVSDFASLADPKLCEVTVISVAKIPYTAAAGYPYPSMVGFDPDLVAEFTKQAQERAQAMAEALRGEGFACEVVATDGSPHHLILDEAKKGGFDLVIVGSHGHGPVRRTLPGSVSDAVARHAQATLVGRTARTD